MNPQPAREGSLPADLAKRVDPKALHRHLEALPWPRRRSEKGPAIAGTLDYLRRSFRQNGWNVADQPCRDDELGDGGNVVATLTGSSRPEEIVVVGAHHDTVPNTPGADDNGSGLAGLLELARLLGSRRWEATIELVAFDFEEQSTFTGSREYVAALLTRELRLRGAFVFEMIGYRDMKPGSQRVPEGFADAYPELVRALEARERRGDFIVALGDAGAPALTLFEADASEAAPGLPVLAIPVPKGITLHDLFSSDHVSFWREGLSAVMLTDSANFRNPHYHGPGDLPETLDPWFWRDVVAATAAAVARLARPL